jgi:hypothetical protein
MFASGNEPIIPRSGDALFDRALAQTLAKISHVFSVLPGFAYYDDWDGENAYASAEVKLGRSDGTVLFGTRMLKSHRSRPEAPEVAVAAVCAHEFGHIVQFKRRLQQRLLANQPTVKRIELHADFLAGYFAGVRKRERSDFPAAVFAVTHRSLGDTHFDNQQHHGTHEERGAAVVEGFRAAKEMNLDFDRAVEAGVSYVKRL